MADYLTLASRNYSANLDPSKSGGNLTMNHTSKHPGRKKVYVFVLQKANAAPEIGSSKKRWRAAQLAEPLGATCGNGGISYDGNDD